MTPTGQPKACTETVLRPPKALIDRPVGRFRRSDAFALRKCFEPHLAQPFGRTRSLGFEPIQVDLLQPSIVAVSSTVTGRSHFPWCPIAIKNLAELSKLRERDNLFSRNLFEDTYALSRSLGSTSMKFRYSTYLDTRYVDIAFLRSGRKVVPLAQL